MRCTFAVRVEGYAPCSCLGSADVHTDSNFGKHVFSFYAFFNNKTCTVSESQPLICGSLWWCSLNGRGHSEFVGPGWEPSFSLHQARLSYILEAENTFGLPRLQSLCIAPVLRLWRPKSHGHALLVPQRDGLCGHHCVGAWGEPFTGMCCILPGNAEPLHQFLPENHCLHPSSCWQCSLWKRGLEAVGEIQLLSQTFQARHKRAPGFPAHREEMV